MPNLRPFSRMDILDRFASVRPITKGWSEDKKYCVTEADGARYLLRVTPMERYEERKALFAMLERIAALGVPMCIPIEFGTCPDGVYSLQSWIDGEDLDTALPLLPETEQYVLGLRAGEILGKIHSIPTPESQEDRAICENKKIDHNMQKYRECGLRFDGDEYVIEYIEQNRHLLENRPLCFQHGDYHVNNMMLEDGRLKIIDFGYGFGDPWQEFESIRWCVDVSPFFATGFVRGYFDGEPPPQFWQLLLLYFAEGMFHNLLWAIPRGQEQIDSALRHINDVFLWTDHMQNPVPAWYLQDFYIQWTDGIPYKLKTPFDFWFLKKYGKVFKVFDDQDSGNICFGAADGENRYFIKFAGAPAARAGVCAEEAVANLKAAVPIYWDLAHPNLVKILQAEEIGRGYAAVFEWVDAECMGRMYPLSRRKFMEMPLETRSKVFEDILAFHPHVAARGYVAVDFYDGSILYDFTNERTVICDIDVYTKKPYTNPVGRMWGSGRFMSPEEFTLGAEIDEVTNVYAMGATAFALFAEYDRSPDGWPLTMELYDVVSRAVSDERDKRQQSVRQLIGEWEAAKV